MNRRRLLLALLVLASGRFLLLGARWARARGPIEFRAPRSVVSNSHPAQREIEPYVLFLGDVRRLLPPGSSVAAIAQESVGTPGITNYLVAIGQLPANSVISWPVDSAAGHVMPRFVAVYREAFADSRYRLVAVLPSGRLYEIKG